MLSKVIKNLNKRKNKVFSISDIIKQKFFPSMPSFATIQEWDDWHEENYKKNPLMYWVVFDLPKIFRKIYLKYYEEVKNEFIYRYIRKYNVIKIKSLKPGYYDTDVRLVHGMFDLLIEHVENEKSILYELSGSEDNDKLKKMSKLEKGIKYLEWETTLTDASSNNYSLEQAKTAQEVLILIDYWLKAKNDYGNIMNHIDTIEGQNFSTFSSIRLDYDEKVILKETEMLIRLIKIRKSLWT